MLADIAARTLPKQIFAAPVLGNAKGSHLPLGEGGSVWFDAPIQPPNKLETDFAAGLAIPIDTAGGKPVFSRHVAFLISAQIYSFFGYREDQVAFASHGEITQESDPNLATLTSMRGYLQGVLRFPLSTPTQDSDRVYWFNMKYLGTNYRVGASEEFVDDHHWTEAELFSALGKYNIPALVKQYGPDQFILITNDGPKALARRT
jgi:hypothetical protein